MKKNNKGFTLAELLIVVAVIAVLVAVAIPTFANQLEKSRQAVTCPTSGAPTPPPSSLSRTFTKIVPIMRNMSTSARHMTKTARLRLMPRRKWMEPAVSLAGTTLKRADW